MTGHPRVVVEADGGSRGNPGPAGYGAVVRDAVTGKVLAERADTLGVTTNNVAEYSGLIAGLEAAASLGAREVDVRLDSKLVVEQMSGRWKIKHPQMRPLASRAAALVAGFDAVRFQWIPRAQNTAADALANSAMDGTSIHRDLRGDGDPDSDKEPHPGHPPTTALPAGTPVTAAPVTAAPVTAAPGPAARPAPGWAAGTLAASAATTTVLVRHAASALSPERRFSGRGDVPLSPDGVEQAKRVATRLAGRAGLSAVVSSPLLRARQTAEAIARALGVDLVVDPDLVETDFGAWEGFTYAEVRERWPAELAAWLAAPAAAPPDGESFAEVEHRVRRAHRRLVETYPAAAVAVVSHVTPVKTLLRLALDAPVATLFRMQLDVTGVSEVDWYADGPANVRLVNDTHHLLI